MCLLMDKAYNFRHVTYIVSDVIHVKIQNINRLQSTESVNLIAGICRKLKNGVAQSFEWSVEGIIDTLLSQLI